VSPARFTMLETIREFALGELENAGERKEMVSRHAAWYVELGDHMREHLLREIDSRWLDRLEVEHGNLRNALVWTLIVKPGPESVPRGLGLVASLWLFWYYHSHLAEGRWWLEHALAAVGEVRDADRAMALVGLGTLAHAQGDDENALGWLTDGLALAREVHDPTVIAFALSVRGNWAEDAGHYEEAGRYFSEANRIFARLDDRVNVAITNYHLGVVAFGQERMEEAEQRSLEALELSRQMDDSWGTALSLAHLGLVRWKQGALAQAADAFDEALALFARIGSTERIADMLCRIGVLAETCDDHLAAFSLFAQAAGMRGRIGAVQGLPERQIYEAAELRARLFADRLGSLGAVAMPERSLDEIVDDAHTLLLEVIDACVLPDAEAEPDGSVPVGELTARELDVLRLIAAGYTNREIASALSISVRTVTSHASAIFNRLGVGSRTAAVAAARERGLV